MDNAGATGAARRRRQFACAVAARLWDARQQRLLAAETTIPAVVWIVTLVGGGLTIAFGSFLGVPSLGIHLAMSAALAIQCSGADPDHRSRQPVPRRFFGCRHCRSIGYWRRSGRRQTDLEQEVDQKTRVVQENFRGVIFVSAPSAHDMDPSWLHLFLI